MASLGNLYPNLPGMLVEFKDGGQALRFNDVETNTDSLLLLGTSIDGPVMEPIAVDIDTVELLLGSDVKSNGVPNGATLLHAFRQAYDAGCQDIRVMRISGEQATSQISAADEVIVSQKRKDENLTVVQGNDATILTLTGKGINSGSIRVFAKGLELTSGFSYDPSSRKVTIQKNVCDAGSSITVKYEYTEQVSATPETLTVSKNSTVKTYKPVIDGTLVVKKGKDVVASENYTVLGNVITFIGGVVEGDEVVVEYKFEQIGFASENGSGKNLFAAATSPQVIKLSEVPMENSTVLYVDDARVLNSQAFSVDATAKTITIKKEYFKMGQVLSVSYYVQLEEVVERTIDLTSIFAGDVYNTGTVEVRNLEDSVGSVIGKTIIITKPESKVSTTELPQEYSSFDYPTFAELVDAINNNNSVYKASTKTPNVLTSELRPSSTYFSGGDNGVNISKAKMFECLSGTRDENGYLVKHGAYQLLENYQVDWVVPVGVYADDELLDRHQNFAYELALFCAVLSYKNKSTYGMIATKPLMDTSLAGVQAHAKYLSKLNTDYFMRDENGTVIRDSQGNPIDLGKFISVVAGPTPKINYNVASLKEGNPAILYAALNTVLQPQSAPTNKKLTGCTGLKYTFSNSQLNDIVGNKIVVFGTKYARNGSISDGAVVIDGPTSARFNSEYTRLTTVKVMRAVSDSVREVADPFIGEANTIEQRNALSAAISKRLDLLVEKGVLIEYSFNLVATTMDQLLGQAKLELAIVAPQELRRITTVIGLKK